MPSGQLSSRVTGISRRISRTPAIRTAFDAQKHTPEIVRWLALLTSAKNLDSEIAELPLRSAVSVPRAHHQADVNAKLGHLEFLEKFIDARDSEGLDKPVQAARFPLNKGRTTVCAPICSVFGAYGDLDLWTLAGMPLLPLRSSFVA